MADADRLTGLGLSVTDGGAGVEAVLQLGTPLLNPLAQRSIPSAVFALAEECLIPLEPPEFVGLPPLLLEGVRSRSELEQQLAGAFHTHLVTLQRRSAELKGLGFASQVNPETLELIARVEDPPFRFVLEGDKRGQLRLAEAARDGASSATDVGEPFNLSEFPNRAGLLAHLRALVEPPEEPSLVASQLPVPIPIPIPYRELLERFGSSAWVPGAAAIDIVVTLHARGTAYRFAATRVSGRTFRALLAGPEGKVWAEQFDLDAFPGVSAVAASALGIPVSEVELPGATEER
jgi:hypothetical protein